MNIQYSKNEQQGLSSSSSSMQNQNFVDTSSVQFVTSNNQNQPPSYYPHLHQQSQTILVKEVRVNQQQPPQQQQQQQQPTIIMRNIIPDHYLVWSIINIIFFNIILGSIVVAFSVSTRRRIKRNLLPEAHMSSKNGFILNLVTTCFGLGFYVYATILLCITFYQRGNFHH